MTDSTTAETAAVLHRIAQARPEPPAGLWLRIESAHAQRVARRHRVVAGGVLGAALIGMAALGVLRSPDSLQQDGASIDWQARAQALELQLQTLNRERRVPVAAYAADPTADELADIDRRLQAAYERGTYTTELNPLWKRRSELLDALIAARKEGLTLTRI